jgi:hypothetical protein
MEHGIFGDIETGYFQSANPGIDCLTSKYSTNPNHSRFVTMSGRQMNVGGLGSTLLPVPMEIVRLTPASDPASGPTQKHPQQSPVC